LTHPAQIRAADKENQLGRGPWWAAMQRGNVAVETRWSHNQAGFEHGSGRGGQSFRQWHRPQGSEGRERAVLREMHIEQCFPAQLSAREAKWPLLER
jgi:hypothetical protein